MLVPNTIELTFSPKQTQDLKVEKALITQPMALAARVYLLCSVSVLGGSWDLSPTYNWADNPTDKPPKWAYGGYPNHK